jgi:hypothetical protein
MKANTEEKHRNNNNNEAGGKLCFIVVALLQSHEILFCWAFFLLFAFENENIKNN